MLSQISAGRVKCVLCAYSGRGLLGACTRFPLDIARCAFFLCCFALYPLAVISHSYEENSIVSPMISSCKSSQLGAADTPKWKDIFHNDYSIILAKFQSNESQESLTNSIWDPGLDPSLKRVFLGELAKLEWSLWVMGIGEFFVLTLQLFAKFRTVSKKYFFKILKAYFF